MQIANHLIERINANRLYRTIGIQLEAAVDGTARSVLIPQADICWPFDSQPHGGILFTIMDTTMAWAIQSELEKGFSCATIDLGIRYLSAARGQKFHCRAETIHQTRRLCFVRAEITDPQKRIIATGEATFRIIKMDFI